MLTVFRDSWYDISWCGGRRRNESMMMKMTSKRRSDWIYSLSFSLSHNDFYLIFIFSSTLFIFLPFFTSLHSFACLLIYLIVCCLLMLLYCVYVYVFNFVIIIFTFIYFFNFPPLQLVYFSLILLYNSSYLSFHYYQQCDRWWWWWKIIEEMMSH